MSAFDNRVAFFPRKIGIGAYMLAACGHGLYLQLLNGVFCSASPATFVTGFLDTLLAAE